MMGFGLPMPSYPSLEWKEVAGALPFGCRLFELPTPHASKCACDCHNLQDWDKKPVAEYAVQALGRYNNAGGKGDSTFTTRICAECLRGWEEAHPIPFWEWVSDQTR